MKTPDILSLCPTQFVLGMKEVDAKVAKMREMKEDELTRYCDDHPIPVIKGLKNSLFMIDHHHFGRACWELGVKKFKIEVLEDLSSLDEKNFWNKMRLEGWTYLFDQFGMGPHSPLNLPANVRCMADDPYRSLVWMLIHQGKIKKSKVPFFEFQWAAFFRANLDIDLHGKSDFEDALNQATKVMKMPGADNFPGKI